MNSIFFSFANLVMFTYRKFNKMPLLMIPVWIGIRFWCIGPGWWWWCECECVGIQTFWNEYLQLRPCVWAPSFPMAKLRLVVARRRRCMRSIGRFSGADMKIGCGWDTCGICDEECWRCAAVAVKCNGVWVCPWWWWSKFSFFNVLQSANKIRTYYYILYEYISPLATHKFKIGEKKIKSLNQFANVILFFFNFFPWYVFWMNWIIEYNI